MDKDQKTSALIEKYEKMLEQDPSSRAFAPLAECYRTLGMTKQALNILRSGIKKNPTYIFGYLGIAACYNDVGQINLAYTTLRPLVADNKDNLRLLKLFAEICEKLEIIDEALETYKYLLFVNPKDKYIADKVFQYEEQDHVSIENTSSNVHFDIDRLEQEHEEDENFEDWVTVDHADQRESTSVKKVQIDEEKNSDEDNLEGWTTEKLDNFNEEVSKITPVEQKEIEISFDRSQLEDNYEPDRKKEIDNAPVVTHTLVDLYLSQGHVEKALEILDKMIELNPACEKTLAKKEEILGVYNFKDEAEEEKEKDNSSHMEEEGRIDLMRILDQKLGKEKDDFIEESLPSPKKGAELKELLLKFQRKIKERSLEKLRN